MIDNELFLTPQNIVAELDKYIIGQQEAKKNVAIALRNRWRRMHAHPDIKKEIMPNNILMIGATGVGKTEIARRLAKLANAPFIKVEASKFTEVGYVGRDVESMVRDLAEQAVNMVKQKKKEEVRLVAANIVDNIILDILIPPIKSNNGFAVSNEDTDLNEKTRERFKEKIKNGELEDKKIEIESQQPSASNVGVIGGPMDESSMMNIQEMISGMMPKKAKKRKVTIAEARKILIEEEAAKLIDMDEVKDEALKMVQETGIIFIDEIDKIASNSRKNGGGADVSREGVQRDLLPIVEGSSVNTKYGIVNTEYILFIAAGAFHVSKPSDLIPELQGRFPIRVELQKLSQEDFFKILQTPKNALTKQYEALLAAEGINLSFEKEALYTIAEIAFQLNEEIENIGARRLHTVMSHLLNELLFDVPDLIPPQSSYIVTKLLVEEKLNTLIKNRDLSEYIL
ncbi:MAG: ATP-dependent protease ATPase subunit HslU [Cytophagales bacterium]|nr:MAG: ATP-dependent protease ATPase subunit HslU [Cytophagales bacterium]